MHLRPHSLRSRLDERHHIQHHTMPILQSRHIPTLALKGTGTPKGLPHGSPQPHHERPLMATNRNTKGYTAWVRRALKECEPVCYRCGYPIDMTLPRNSPDGASAEHKNPLAEGGDLIPSMEDTALSHLRCNRQHGGIIGSRKSSASKPGTKTNRRTDFLDNDLLSLEALHLSLLPATTEEETK